MFCSLQAVSAPVDTNHELLVERLLTEDIEQPFHRTEHPDAQWYPDAGFGLFMHWGIHSVAGIQPSWAMIKDYPYGYHPRYEGKKYYDLADQFNPQNYNPNLWMKAAKEAGFTYAVLTTKHHDGYALWPTRYGKMSTRHYMNGRDLLRPYVEACRKYGLKVGFYFSPRDWSYPGYPLADVDFDHNKRGQFPPIEDPEKNRKEFEKFYAYTIGQLHELLTRYGKIDLLWFDGMGWRGIDDLREKETLAWIRSLQPGIVINDRWDNLGDFETVEWRFAEDRPEDEWWEYCISWNGHWGYNPNGRFRPAAWVLAMLARCRAWGGNFLLNVGPVPDGTMPAGFYERCEELASWMSHSRKSVIGADPVENPDCCNVPVTQNEGIWYVHLLREFNGAVTIEADRKPKDAILFRTGENVDFQYQDGIIRIELSADQRTDSVDVIAIRW